MKLTLEDLNVGDLVTYYPAHSMYNPMHKDVENGIVSSKNESYVFVRYIRFGRLMQTGENTPIKMLKKGHHKPNVFIEKILFLDIDDVICLWKQYDKPRHTNEVPPFDQKAVKVLNQILEDSECEIVISSDWKDHCTLHELQEIFRFNNVIKFPIATTNSICYGDCKDEEILNYVEAHKPTKWVAIDDMDLAVPNFVKCSRLNEGIKQTGIKEKILKYLM